jgi:CrcB protein
MTLLQALTVFVGGGLGSLGRYSLNIFIAEKGQSLFPLGTFIVNLIGCFLIGIIAGVSEKYWLNPYFALLLATGFCGGFTTFSSFSLENNLLVKESEYLMSFVYTFLSITWGFSLTFLAIYLIRKI